MLAENEKLIQNVPAPVLIIGFNRPDLLKNVLSFFSNTTRSIYISIDGPRNLLEKTLTEECRLVAENYKISHKNKVSIRINTVNLGCKLGVTSAIDWAFEFEEYLVILEDDISISQNFLDFCDLGLIYFQANKKIFQLSGWTPLLPEFKPPEVYLTRFSHIWGWATWKDRWALFDSNLESWDNFPPSDLPIFHDAHLHKNFDSFWRNNLANIKAGATDIWDVQWMYSMWSNQRFAVSPGLSLCKNIGFDDRATHTLALPENMFKYQRKTYLADPLEVNLDWLVAFKDVDSSFIWDIYHEKIAFNMDFYNLNSISDNKRHLLGKILSILHLKKLVKNLYSSYLQRNF